MIVFREIEPGKFLLDKDSFRTIHRYDTTLKKMFLSQHNIYETRDDQRGVNCKFWIKNQSIPNGLLFKYPELRSNGELVANNYGELLVTLICDKAGLEHTSYYPCKFVFLDNAEFVGTLCPSYRTSQYDTEYSAQNITTRYVQSQYDNNFGVVDPMQPNTVYEYLKQIKTLYPKWVQASGISQLKDSLLKLALLDFLTMQVDRHWGNFGFLNNSNKGMRTIKMIPVFDSGCSFYMNKPLSKMDTLYKSLKNTKDWQKRIILPMATGKDSAPLLGIKTSLVDVKDDKLLVNRKYAGLEKNNVQTFIDEISDEIINSQSLSRFYNKMRSIDVEELFTQSGYFPEHIVSIASKIWTTRMNLLQKTLDNKRSVQNER